MTERDAVPPSGHATDKAPADVVFRGISKRYGEVLAVDRVDLEIPRGAFVSLLGPSGCGKTTSLRVIAGFEQPSAGEVLIGGEAMNGVPAHRRPVNMVFQHYALFPHLNVFDNIAYGLRQQRPRLPRDEVAERVAAAMEMVRLGDFGRRMSWELSGGQQQRVALARALVNRPKVLLLDEPLAALDRKLRREMQIELQTLQRNVGVTFVLVTHDQEEALSMSNRVYIMRDGRIVQHGTPRELYDNPTSRYVADFVGKCNFFPGRVGSVRDGIVDIALDSGATLPARMPGDSAPPAGGARAVLGVRPEHVLLARAAEDLPAETVLRAEARVLNHIFLGEHTEYLLSEPALGEFLALTPRQAEVAESLFETGETVHAGWLAHSAIALPDH